MRIRYPILLTLALLAVAAGVILARLVALRTAPHPTIHPETVAPPVTTDDVLARLDVARMQAHVAYLAGTIGVRRSGTAGEQKAADYMAAQLTAVGYMPQRESVSLPHGKTSQNVIARLPGKSDRLLIIGAHLDSKKPSPGANDNASGVAVVLEVARALKTAGATPPCTLLFVGFGAEEMVDANPDHHHYGSRALAHRLRAEHAPLTAMIRVDMVGVGTQLHIDGYRPAPTTWRDALARAAAKDALAPKTGFSRPWSDHEAFATPTTPVAYLHWETDPHYHHRTDTPTRLNPNLMQKSARCLLRTVME